VARSFIGTGAVAYESGKLHNREVPGVGILHEGSDKSAPSKCAAGGTFRENPGGVPDGIGANGTESVATVENQFAPPIKASARSQITGRRRRFSARKASARRSLERVFMMFEPATVAGPDGTVADATGSVH
jgi:hypothetical protein